MQNDRRLKSDGRYRWKIPYLIFDFRRLTHDFAPPLELTGEDGIKKSIIKRTGL